MTVWRNYLCAVIGSLSYSVGVATAANRLTTDDEMIARQAEIHGVPRALIQRVVKRESRYQPGLVHRHCFGHADQWISLGLALFERLQIGDQICDLIRIEAKDRHRRVSD